MSAKHHFHLLDGLRGLAALAVVWGHIHQMADKPAPPQFYLAVDFFFMLSGFVIAHAYQARLDHGMTVARFCKLRLVRLYPIFLLGTMLGVGVLILRAAIEGEPEWWQIGVSSGLALLALPSFWIPIWLTAFPVNGPLWSISFEFLINLLYAPLARVLTTQWLIAFTLLGALSLIFCVWYWGEVNAGFNKDDLPVGFARVLFGFAAGLLLYKFRPKFVTPVAVGICIAIALTALLTTPWQLEDPLQLALVFCAFPAMLWLGASVRVQGSTLAACAVLGELSYPLYATHMPLVRVLDEVSRRANIPEQFAIVFYLISLACTVGFGWAAFRAFDRPVRKWLLRPRGVVTPDVKELHSSS